jgi:hypothetical protein
MALTFLKFIIGASPCALHLSTPRIDEVQVCSQPKSRNAIFERRSKSCTAYAKNIPDARLGYTKTGLYLGAFSY